jgi:hypothetical protein
MVEIRVGEGLDVIEGVDESVEVGDGVADGKQQPGEGVALSTKSLARLVSNPAGRRSSEWPWGTFLQGGDIMVLMCPQYTPWFLASI